MLLKVGSVLNQVSISLLKESLQTIGSDAQLKTKEELIERMKKDIVEIGIEEIICQLQEETLQSMMKNLGEIHPELDNIHLSVEKGLKQMFPSLATFNTDMLKKICSDLGLNRTSYNERATLESLIINELILTGIEAFLTLLTLQELKKFCTQLGLKSTGKKQDVVERIVFFITGYTPDTCENVEHIDTLDEPTGTCEVVQLVAKGEACLEKFCVKDLKSFCVQNGIKSDGKKAVLIKRIKEYLAVNKENLHLVN